MQLVSALKLVPRGKGLRKGQAEAVQQLGGTWGRTMRTAWRPGLLRGTGGLPGGPILLWLQ